MKTTPLEAAIERLTAFAEWDGDTSPNPYNDSGHTEHEDLNLVLRSLKLLDGANHIDDADAEPIFELRPECLWTNAKRGLIHCLGKALLNEDAPDGETFQ